jgi:hypothetical protein
MHVVFDKQHAVAFLGEPAQGGSEMPALRLRHARSWFVDEDGSCAGGDGASDLQHPLLGAVELRSGKPAPLVQAR